MVAHGAGIAPKHIRALVVDEDADAAAHWARVAFDDVSLDVHLAATIAGALQAAESLDLDIAIVGGVVADGSYRDLLRALHLAREDLAVLVVAQLGRHALREAFALGATDVVAPGDLMRLGPAIVRALHTGVMSAT